MRNAKSIVAPATLTGGGMDALLSPRSVALIGASEREGSIGRSLLSNLQAAGFTGSVHPVHPTAKTVLGLPAVAHVGDIAGGVDMAIVAVPAALVEGVVKECADAGVRAAVIISSGFAEASGDGRVAQQRLVDIARKAGMRLVGPNCMGVLNTEPHVRLNATFAPCWPPAGNVSMASQSGALGIAMLAEAERLNLGLADFVSMGNKADVSSNDLLDHWKDDPRTKVIALYLESFGNPRKFARMVPEVAREKPIVAVKSGRSAAGSRAAASHSAALASLDIGIDALFAQAGVIRTTTLEELFDVVSLLSSQPVPRGRRVGIVTNAGGPGILLADACEAHGLQVATLTDDTVARLRACLPAQAGLSNPIDMLAAASPAQYAECIATVGADPGVDAVVAIYIPPMVTSTVEIAQAVAAGAGRMPADKPIAAVFMAGKGTPAELSRGPRGPIPAYAYPENVALALAAAVRYHDWRERPQGSTRRLDARQQKAVRKIVDRLCAEPPAGGWVPQEDLVALLGLAGIPTVPQVIVEADPWVAGVTAESVGYPCVLKAQAPGLIHKTDVGAVQVGLEDARAVELAARGMIERLAERGLQVDHFVIQPQVEGHVQMLVGVIRDATLGHLMVVGEGGTAAELSRDAAMRLVPVTDVDVGEMLGGLRMAPRFTGFRGAPPADRQALTDLVLQLSALVDQVPELQELDLNPVLLRRPGEGACVVDCRMRLARL